MGHSAHSISLGSQASESSFLKLPFEFQWRRHLADVSAAVFAAASVTPIVASVDKAVIQNAAGKVPLFTSIMTSFRDVIMKPSNLRRPEFVMVCGVYAFTYAVANTTETICQEINTSENTKAVTKFTTTTAANMSASMVKDSVLASTYGGNPGAALPASTFGCFLFRDAMTVATAFTLVPIASAKLQERGFSKLSADTTAQIVLPVAAQVVTTPAHLLGLDLHNRRGVTWASRSSFLSEVYIKSCVARMMRILPAFGIGGVGNKHFRKAFKSSLGVNDG